MKKVIYLSIAALVSFAACQKEENPAQQENGGLTLTASIEQQADPSATRTALGAGNTVVWSEGDQIKIIGTSSSHETFTLTDGAGTTTGTFNGPEIANPQYAFYPASAVSGVSGSNVTFTLPAIQNYAENTFENGANIAAALVSGTEMQFKNVCGVLKFQFKGTALVKSITVTGKNNEKLSGTYTLDVSAATPELTFGTAATEAEKSVTLDCGTGVMLDPETAKAFYIVVPKGSFTNGFNVKVNDYGTSSDDFIAKSNTINRNTILSMPEKSIIGCVLPGKFSVSETKKVRFSSGNLVATIDASGNPTAWKFANNQYTVLASGGANTKIGTEAGDVDSFCISTNGDAATADYKAWGINNSLSNSDYNGKFVDWGTNPEIIASLGSSWRLLTVTEFNYLFNVRSASTIGGVENARFATFSIAGKRVFVLFPDNFVWNTETMGDVPETINNENGGFGASYTLENYLSMESAGAVVYPICGYRRGTTINMGRGDYWLASEKDKNGYFGAFRVAAPVKLTTESPYNGSGVRFVADCK